MQSMDLFVPITKVDAAQRLVYGVVTAEREDRAGEICDYATTKPFYEKWSCAIQKATDGRSLGNLRAMHGRNAAGKITALAFDDKRKTIEICAKVVDNDEWDKVSEGVYTGFSQGGAYVKRWQDDDGLMRYTADPSEVSLVDLPCLPLATFQMIKSNGETERLPFKNDPAAGEEWEQVWRSKRDGASFKSKAELRKHHEALDAVRKIGARNSHADQDLIQTAHDALVALGARCDGFPGRASSAGAAQNDDDASAAADPGGDNGSDPDLAQTIGSFRDQLAKLTSERDIVRRDLATLAPVLDEILKRVKTMEGQPTPLPFAGQPRAVSKDDDLLARAPSDPDEIAKFIENNRDALSLEAIKQAQRRPQRLGARR